MRWRRSSSPLPGTPRYSTASPSRDDVSSGSLWSSFPLVAVGSASASHDSLLGPPSPCSPSGALAPSLDAWAAFHTLYKQQLAKLGIWLVADRAEMCACVLETEFLPGAETFKVRAGKLNLRNPRPSQPGKHEGQQHQIAKVSTCSLPAALARPSTRYPRHMC